MKDWIEMTYAILVYADNINLLMKNMNSYREK
jgi:hypothetical protein